MKTEETITKELISSLLKTPDDFEITMNGKQFRELIRTAKKEMLEEIKGRSTYCGKTESDWGWTYCITPELMKEMLDRLQEEERVCPNCSRMLPGGYIRVDDVKNPHCADCGKKILKEENHVKD